jgi:predicted O-methyltransferase YrrM
MLIPELERSYPHWTLGAVDQLKAVLQPFWRAFEWGAGDSTLWLAQRTAHVVTVEGDTRWHDKTRSELVQFGISNVTLILAQTEAVYVSMIDNYPAFDVVCIDGRHRADCIAHAVERVKVGGYLVLDNSERAQYQDAMRLMAAWRQWDYPKDAGHPGYGEWETTVWQKA